MKKRTLSLLLAFVMLFSVTALSACSDPEGPPIGTGDVTNADVSTDSGSKPDTEPADTTPSYDENGLLSEYFSDYVRDEDANFVGKVGIGIEGESVVFDNFRVLTPRSAEMYANDFETDTEIRTDIFTPMTAPGGDWDMTISDFLIMDEDAEEPNKMLTFADTVATGAMLTMGNPLWGPYRVNSNIMVIEGCEGRGVARIYFCMTDESNYYCLEIGSGDEAAMTVYQTVNGETSEISKLGVGISAGSWIPVSVNVARDIIYIYVGGIEYFHISSEPSDAELIKGKFGIGQWNTQFYIDDFKVEDIYTGETIYFQDFENAANFVSSSEFGVRNGGNWSPADNSSGEWVVTKELDADGNELDNHVLYFSGATSIAGAVIAFDVDIPDDCRGYKITCAGKRLAGSGSYEGWTLIWGWQSGNDYVNYNLNGWSGCAGFQEIVAGVKTNTTTTELIGMENNLWQYAEILVYPEVSYAYFEGRFLQNLWS